MIKEFIKEKLEKYDREFVEYRKQFTDPEYLHRLDESHHRFMCDHATDMEEAYYDGIVASAGKVEAVRKMKADGCSHRFICLMTGLSSVEIDKLS
jgi:hypothetical protein